MLQQLSKTKSLKNVSQEELGLLYRLLLVKQKLSFLSDVSSLEVERLIDSETKQKVIESVQNSDFATMLLLETGNVIRVTFFFEHDYTDTVLNLDDSLAGGSVVLHFKVLQWSRQVTPTEFLQALSQKIYKEHIQKLQRTDVKLRAVNMKLVYPFQLVESLHTINDVYYGRRENRVNVAYTSLIPFQIVMNNALVKSTRNNGSILIPFVDSEARRYTTGTNEDQRTLFCPFFG